MTEEKQTRPKRIIDIVKELNISHNDIISFLEKEGFSGKITLMTVVDEDWYLKIVTEFSKEKEYIERLRKEKARKEAEAKRKVEEEQRRQAEAEKRRVAEEVYKTAATLFEKAVVESVRFLSQLKESIATNLIELKPQVTTQTQPSILVKEKEIEAAAGARPVEAAPQALKEKPKDRKKLRRITVSQLDSILDIKGGSKHVGGEESYKKGKRMRTIEKVDDSLIEKQIRRTLASVTGKPQHKKRKEIEVEDSTALPKKIKVTEFITVDNLANLMGLQASDIIAKAIELKTILTRNQRLDYDMIAILADELGYEVEKVDTFGEDIFNLKDTEEDKQKAKPRPPVVAIMGHVDHGKTSLLDFIRKSNVVAGESGGITQHIGAYKVELPNKKTITFLDTPGHEAFTAMRARGAQVTDIVILIVAADDGVMPQTIEAIHHAQAANVPIVVAINKIDKPEADPERVKRELANNNVLVESWGGKVQVAEISAKTGKNVDHLLELILLEAEMLDLKANYDTLAKATVIESRIDKRHGPTATVIVHKGTLKIGDPFVCGSSFGKVRALLDERGQRIKAAYPSDPVVVVGFSEVPKLAEILAIVADEREARRIATERDKIEREQQRQKQQEWSLDAISAKIAQGKVKQLRVILKCDVDGSVEALSQQMVSFGNEEVSVDIIHKAAGAITESDVLLAKASEAVIIAFNVAVNPKVADLARRENVEIRRYSIIYEIEEDIKNALEGLLTPERVEEQLGTGEVLQVFKISKFGTVAGTLVKTGKVTRNARVRVKRDGQVVFEGEISSLKRFKEDRSEVTEGLECGLSINGFDDIQEKDLLEFFTVKTIKRTLN
jgi:translation initiation factor IF-2